MINIKTNNVTYNIDKLPLEVVGMLSFLIDGEIEGFEDAYMVEIKLDDPIKHIKDGDEFFIIHQGSDQYMSYAKYLVNKDWAIVHKSIFGKMKEQDKDRFSILLKKYFETGELSKRKETPPGVQRKRF